jgi:hypothetical protein
MSLRVWAQGWESGLLRSQCVGVKYPIYFVSLTPQARIVGVDSDLEVLVVGDLGGA